MHDYSHNFERLMMRQRRYIFPAASRNTPARGKKADSPFYRQMLGRARHNAHGICAVDLIARFRWQR